MQPQTSRPPVLPPELETPVNPELAYLFVAEFADGFRIEQNPDDLSMLRPDKTAFYDVQEYAKNSPVARFWLTDRNMWYMVDLRDGTFEVNGVPFEAFDPYNNPYVKLQPPLRLIYYPKTDMVDVVDQNSSAKVTGHKRGQVRYFLGWQFTDAKGRNYQQAIAIR